MKLFNKHNKQEWSLTIKDNHPCKRNINCACKLELKSINIVRNDWFKFSPYKSGSDYGFIRPMYGDFIKIKSRLIPKNVKLSVRNYAL